MSLQADFEGSASLLSRMAEEGSPEDIENFEIFKGNAALVCVLQDTVGLDLCQSQLHCRASDFSSCLVVSEFALHVLL